MAKKALPDADLLRQLLTYNPETGELVWLPRDRAMFANTMQHARWNIHYGGKIAGCLSPTRKYRCLKILGREFFAHRIIWKLVTGADPEGEVDHINRDKIDNRWANLRDVSHSVNMMNVRMRPSNTTGHKHISWFPRLKKWTVCMGVPGKRGSRQLGYYDTIEQAVTARQGFYLQFDYAPELVAS